MASVARPLAPLALAYHGVRDVPLRADPHRLFTAPAALRRQVRLLGAGGYAFTTASDLARRAAAGQASGWAALTFDDAFDDGLVATLAGLGVPATVFAVSGWLGDVHPDVPGARLLGARALRSLRSAGIEIGAHTAAHLDLTRQATASLTDELVRGRAELEAALDAPVRSLAYPYGAADDRVVRAACAAGFQSGWLATAEGSWSEPLRLPRHPVLNGCTLIGLRIARRGHYARLARAPGVRQVRRLRRRARGHRPVATR